jgi:iron complex transport system substrate-binding protein
MASKLSHPCRVISLDPKCIGDVLNDILLVGKLTGTEHEADELVASLRRRIGRIGIKTTSINNRPAVFCMEWIDPPYSAGHWVPEMVDIAGGFDPIGRRSEDSTRVTWETIASHAPDVAVVIPCGFDLERTGMEYRSTTLPAQWQEIPAVRDGRVYAADANAYFSRCGPRLVDGIEVLAEILHPDLFLGIAPKNSWTSLG